MVGLRVDLPRIIVMMVMLFVLSLCHYAYWLIYPGSASQSTSECTSEGASEGASKGASSGASQSASKGTCKGTKGAQKGGTSQGCGQGACLPQKEQSCSRTFR